jgi:hypothetical protein
MPVEGRGLAGMRWDGREEVCCLWRWRQMSTKLPSLTQQARENSKHRVYPIDRPVERGFFQGVLSGAKEG